MIAKDGTAGMSGRLAGLEGWVLHYLYCKASWHVLLYLHYSIQTDFAFLKLQRLASEERLASLVQPSL